MLHIWGRLSSINVRKVVYTAQVLGLEFQRTEAGGAFGVVREADYLRLNPNALVPLIRDDAVTLWESNVIVRYLCARHSSGHMYPETLPERFEAEKWMDWQQTSFNPAGRDAFLQWIRVPPEQRQPALLAQSVAATEHLLAMLEDHLSHHAFMVGNEIGMADIPIACEIHRWWGLPQVRKPWPHIERWYAHLCAQSAAAGVLDLPLA